MEATENPTDTTTSDAIAADAAALGEIEQRIRTLRQRAESLREHRDDVPELVARTYRRRAQELDLEAHVLDAMAIPRRILTAA